MAFTYLQARTTLLRMETIGLKSRLTYNEANPGPNRLPMRSPR